MPRPSTPAAAPAIEVRALSKLYGQNAALLDVTFSVTPGELVGLVGPPRGGRTTLLKLLAGHLTPTGGRIQVCGIDVRVARLALTAHVGYVPQARQIRGDMRPWDLLAFSGRARQIPRDQLEGRLREVAALCNLGDELHAPCRLLDESGRARVALAQALLHDPLVLLLDEFLTGLDSAVVSDLTVLLRRLRGRTTLIVTGSPSLVALLQADRTLLLDRGHLVLEQTAHLVGAGRA